MALCCLCFLLYAYLFEGLSLMGLPEGQWNIGVSVFFESELTFPRYQCNARGSLIGKDQCIRV